MKNNFDEKKAIEVIRYIVNNGINDIYHIVKVMYFADKFHLENYGLLITDDRYTAMEFGPVPSEMYDIIKGIKRTEEKYHGFYVRGHDIFSSSLPDMDYLSKSDRKALDFAIDEIINLSFNELKEKSHDSAYNETPEGKEMPLELIAKMFRNSEDLIEYINR
jgi:uncharacterized phage-associated protein